MSALAIVLLVVWVMTLLARSVADKTDEDQVRVANVMTALTNLIGVALAIAVLA